MTIELTTEDLNEIMEQANRCGLCMLKNQDTHGDPVWISVQNHRKTRGPRKTAASADPLTSAMPTQ